MNTRQTIRLNVLCAAVLLAYSANADTATEQNLPQIEVKGTLAVPKPQIIVNPQIQSHNPSNLKQMLQNEVGVAIPNVQRTRQGNDSVVIRGLGGNRVNLTWDGIPMPEAQESRVFSSAGLAFGRGAFVEPTALRSVGIFRQAQAEGLAGAVKFETLDADDLLHNQKVGGIAQASYNSADNAKTVAAGVAAEQGMWQGMMFGAFRKGNETKTRGNVGGSGSLRTEADPLDFNSQYLLSKQHLQINPEHRVSLHGEYFKRKQDIEQLSQYTDAVAQNTNNLTATRPNATFYNQDHTRDVQKRQRLSLAHRYQSAQSPIQEWHNLIYWQNSQTDNHRQRSGSNTRVDLGNSQDKVWGINSDITQRSFQTGNVRQTWQYGVKLAQHDLQYDAIRLPAPTGRFAPTHEPSADTKRLTVHGYTHGNFDAAKWQAQIGLGVDYYRLMPDQSFGSLNPIATIEKQSRFAVSPNVNLSWKAHSLFRPYVQYSHGFHAPSSQQLSSSWGMNGMYAVVGNSKLKPETAHQFEVGVRGKNHNVDYQINVFDSHYKNFIDYRTVQNLNMRTGQMLLIQYDNFDKARIYGSEGSLNWQFAPNWTLNSAFAFARGYTENGADLAGSNDNNSGKRPIDSISPFKVQLGASYAQEKWGANALITRANGKSSSALSGNVYNPTRHYTLLDLGGYWQPTRKLKVSANVNNVFNRKYWNWGDIAYLSARSTYAAGNDPSVGSINAQNADAFSATGRNVNVGVRYEF